MAGTKIKIKVGKEDVEQGMSQPDFEQAPVGLYTAVIGGIKQKFAKTDGEEDKSRPYLDVMYKINGVGREGKKPEKAYSGVFDTVSFSVGWKLAQLGVACGLNINAAGELDDDIEIDPDKPGTVIGREVLLRVKKGSDNDGNYKAKVGAVMPLDGGPKVDGTVAGDEEVEEEIEDEDDSPFGEGNAPDEGDYLTEEALAEMDLKELGKVATEFDLVPQDHIVKTRGKTDGDKTKAAIIAAILEAQGADAEGDSDDDADPF